MSFRYKTNIHFHWKNAVSRYGQCKYTNEIALIHGVTSMQFDKRDDKKVNKVKFQTYMKLSKLYIYKNTLVSFTLSKRECFA